MSPASVFAKGNVALITGGASGVGLAVAQICRSHSMKIALVDNNTSFLTHAKKQLGDDAELETYEMDVSKVEQWEDLRENVKRKFGNVDLLMLNAGIALKSGWDDASYFKKIMDVNLFGQINGLNTFLPMLQANSKPSSIVMTGSKQGITNPPGNPAYNASKSAIKTLAEHLSYDLRDSPISVHLLVPGFTFTSLSGNVPDTDKQKPDGAWWPSQCADYLVRKMGEGGAKGTFYVLCPDNMVDEDTDRRRMLWGVGDLVYQRQPLSRWRDEYKKEFEETTKAMKI